MNRKYVVLSALVACLLPVTVVAQVSPAPPSAAPSEPAAAPAAAPAEPAMPVPQAFPAKVALIAFEECVVNTNEGLRAMEAVQKKYEPKQAELTTLGNEIASLQKQLQSAPASMTDEQRATLTRNLDAKQKQYNRDMSDDKDSYTSDLQTAYGKVAQKVNAVLVSYVEKNGYTILLDVGSQQSNVMWAAREPSADITEEVIKAYNASTPEITAPPPAAPSSSAAPRKPAASTPAQKPATAPRTTTTPKPPSQ